MTTKPLRLVERLKERAESRRPKPKNWFDRLPPEHQKEFADARNAWRAGLISTSAVQLAKEIVEECQKAGVDVCGPAGVRMWLSQG